MINCLMNTGGRPLSDATSEALLQGARRMADERRRHLTLEEPTCTGYITTSFKTGTIGTISGVEFIADIVAEYGPTTVTYLVRNFDLDGEDGPWVYGTQEAAELLVGQEEAASARRLN